MINTSNYTGKDNTPWPAWPGTPTPASWAAARPGAPSRAAAAGRRRLAAAGRMLLSWLGGLLRRLGDRLFMMNDAEARWRDWQVIRTHGGLGRRYRDPQFDTLAECSQCSGAGRGAGLTADRPCPLCASTGRMTLGEVS